MNKHKKRPSKLKDFEKTHQIPVRVIKINLEQIISPQGIWQQALDKLERELEQEEQRKQRGIIFNWYITIIISVFMGILIGWLII
jgi:hypothetical protein